MENMIQYTELGLEKLRAEWDCLLLFSRTMQIGFQLNYCC